MTRAQEQSGGGIIPQQTGPTPRAWVTWTIVAVIAAIAVLPLAIGAADHMAEPFSGADGQAEETIEVVAPDYEPWWDPIYEAPSGEIESALFALQAAIGAGVIGYFFGAARTRSRLQRESAAASGAHGDSAAHDSRDDPGTAER
ncbi:energy-coupling factor ABC transporter substrate-binding protein [Allosalinactinospora lopnorensis]|uniref:energy-coupling factor ABC transporter substrate-binding protein n=1 Tax=Allosalinactinospora lopnorensis TaxID=1352348 RepID=UPI0009E19912|nr:energy-coupling factor ABC transporter substrate-binding protein [Allosalinactinospora lopnorensis]